MSTINTILSSLTKLSNDKKEVLLNRYSESSQWLSNEIELIVKLIQQNPREKSTLISLTQPLPQVPHANQSKKRKSPETTLDKLSSSEKVDNNSSSDIPNDEKVSPDQKRHSKEEHTINEEIDDLILQAGLILDLNKLKKEQLIDEIEKRSQYSNGAIASMKSLKKDLIDILKSTLFEENKQKSSLSSSQETTNSANKTGPVRKGSLMAEFRTIVNNRESLTVDSASSEWKHRIESEFQARQSRHTAIRKSSATVAHISSEQIDKVVEDDHCPPVTDVQPSKVLIQINTQVDPFPIDKPIEKEVVLEVVADNIKEEGELSEEEDECTLSPISESSSRGSDSHMEASSAKVTEQIVVVPPKTYENGSIVSFLPPNNNNNNNNKHDGNKKNNNNNTSSFLDKTQAAPKAVVVIYSIMHYLFYTTSFTLYHYLFHTTSFALLLYLFYTTSFTLYTTSFSLPLLHFYTFIFSLHYLFYTFTHFTTTLPLPHLYCTTSFTLPLLHCTTSFTLHYLIYNTSFTLPHLHYLFFTTSIAGPREGETAEGARGTPTSEQEERARTAG